MALDSEKRDLCGHTANMMQPTVLLDGTQHSNRDMACGRASHAAGYSVIARPWMTGMRIASDRGIWLLPYALSSRHMHPD